MVLKAYKKFININYILTTLLLLYIVFVKFMIKHIQILFKSKIFNLVILLLICFTIKNNIILGILLTISYILSYVLIFKINIENFNDKNEVKSKNENSNYSKAKFKDGGVEEIVTKKKKNEIEDEEDSDDSDEEKDENDVFVNLKSYNKKTNDDDKKMKITKSDIVCDKANIPIPSAP